MAKYCDDVDYNYVVLHTIHSWPFVMKAINLQIYVKVSLTELVSDSPERSVFITEIHKVMPAIMRQVNIV
jgi:hypothetical protein